MICTWDSCLYDYKNYPKFTPSFDNCAPYSVSNMKKQDNVKLASMPD